MGFERIGAIMLSQQDKSEIEAAIRKHRSLRGARRALAGKVGESPDGPSIKTLRRIHRAMTPPVVLTNVGGRPPTYTKTQRLEMGRLMNSWELHDVLDILSQPNHNLHNIKILPGVIHVTPPTLYKCLDEYRQSLVRRRRRA